MLTFKVSTIKQAYWSFYVMFSTLIFWVLTSYLLLYSVYDNHNNDAELLNISGMQRMLSQKTALDAMHIIYQDDKAPAAIEFKELIGLMKDNHEYLTKHVQDEAIYSMYFNKPIELDKEIKKYILNLNTFIQNPTRDLYHDIQDTSESILPLLQHLVELRQSYSADGWKAIGFYKVVIPIGLLLTLILEYIFILLPIIRRLNKENKEFKAAKEKANEATIAKSQFLANMSHEIRTPMNGMLGFIEQLAKGEKDPDRLKQFQTIKTSGEALVTIINEILDFSKIESGKMDIELHPCDIYGLLENSRDVFSQVASKKDITFVTKLDKALPHCILTDSIRLKQVIFNLLSNSIKFSSKKGTVTLEAKYKSDIGNLDVSVIDTGIGIAPENLDKIFHAFSQEDVSTTRKFGGTGLGLTISSKIVKMMKGQLKVESKLGEGSHFNFSIPVEICSESVLDDSSDISDETDLDEISLSGHLLVVEDNKTNQMLMGIILDGLNLSYDIANDGVEAFEEFKENAYDIVLMDENMPNMNGVEATQHIRKFEELKSKDAVPIIAVTANTLAQDRQRFLDAGMTDYIAKPYTEKDIIDMLRKYLS